MSSLANQAEKADMNFAGIPIIDLTEISSTDSTRRRSLAEEIRNACINVGFFYVKNHGIEDKIIQETLGMAKDFFSLPLDVKMEIENRKNPNFKGYHPLLSGNNDPEGAGDLQEGFEFGWEDPSPGGGEIDNGIMAGANVWPSEIPEFREKVLKYYYAAVKLGKSLFPLFAQALNLPETFFDDKTLKSAALMKLLHYPPQTGPVDDPVVGIGAHTDWECFTILWQEPGIQALQVLNSSKEWIDAPPIPGTLVINLGDQFARWTNDIFKSTVHRAINRNNVHRYSIPLFFGTDYDVELEPIPGCTSDERPPRYKVITAGEYVKARLEATYAQATHITTQYTAPEKV
ncbi:2-oxoglutarate-Fe(II) type oxidoreductase [Hypsizygus marmoreus]|uniref:2-oxoglutarate-Fe(II) type oxidoreductase n=1 Tax=Hypsizygus marmoreus TaxID=39966 RepID=A0A369J2K1_HYPMA|nr:2-oxoglutarate-Fe(II) type oxidoreductase [Hypsizygus marmoreus]